MSDYHRHFTGLLYTLGVKVTIAEEQSAYWLIDAIGSYQHTRRVKAEEFQVWKLATHADGSATLTMTDGNSGTPIVTQQIPMTDFAEPECVLYVCRSPGEPPVLMLPDEY